MLRAGFGLADRSRGLPMTPTTRLAIASGSKTFTALAVLSLVDDGVLALDTPAREWLGEDLPLVSGDVTIEHLLSHRSGIGDYLDEDSDVDLGDYPMPVPVHRLDHVEAYVPLLDGFPTKFPAGTDFSYCNGGFVILALVAERASGTPFPQLVHERVCVPGGLEATGYPRSDALPGDAALGYVEVEGQWRTTSSTSRSAAPATAEPSPRSTTCTTSGPRCSAVASCPRRPCRTCCAPGPLPDESGSTYGLGLWLDPGDGSLQLVGEDAGASFTSVHLPRDEVTWTVMANTMGAAWPVHRAVADHVGRPPSHT